MAGIGAFWGTRAMEIVKKHDSGGLVWKRIKAHLYPQSQRQEASPSLLNEAVLRACADQPPSKTTDVVAGEKDWEQPT